MAERPACAGLTADSHSLQRRSHMAVVQAAAAPQEVFILRPQGDRGAEDFVGQEEPLLQARATLVAAGRRALRWERAEEVLVERDQMQNLRRQTEESGFYRRLQDRTMQAAEAQRGGLEQERQGKAALEGAATAGR